MAVSSSAMGKVVGKGYVPTGAAWGPGGTPLPHPPATSAATTAASPTASLVSQKKKSTTHK